MVFKIFYVCMYIVYIYIHKYNIYIIGPTAPLPAESNNIEPGTCINIDERLAKYLDMRKSTLSLSFSLPLSLLLSFSYSLSLTHTHTHAHTHTRIRVHTLSLKHTHILSLSLSLFLTHSHKPSLSLADGQNLERIAMIMERDGFSKEVIAWVKVLYYFYLYIYI